MNITRTTKPTTYAFEVSSKEVIRLLLDKVESCNIPEGCDIITIQLDEDNNLYFVLQEPTVKPLVIMNGPLFG